MDQSRGPATRFKKLDTLGNNLLTLVSDQVFQYLSCIPFLSERRFVPCDFSVECLEIFPVRREEAQAMLLHGTWKSNSFINSNLTCKQYPPDQTI